VRDDIPPPTQKFVQAISLIVITAAVVVAAYLLIHHFLGGTRL
jgi:hypothetical protein